MSTTHMSFNVIIYLMLTWITRTSLKVRSMTHITHRMPTWLTHTSITFLMLDVSMLTWITKAPSCEMISYTDLDHPDPFICQLFDLHRQKYANLAHPYIYHFLNVICIYADMNNQGPFMWNNILYWLGSPRPLYMSTFWPTSPNICWLGLPIHLSIA